MKAKKKVLALVLSMAMMATVAACGGEKPVETKAPDPTASQETPVGGKETEPLKYCFIMNSVLGTQAFADVVDIGLRKAAEDFDAEYSVLEKVEDSAVADTMRTVISTGVDLIVVATAGWNEAIGTVADEYPDFPIVNLDSDGLGTLSSAHSNVYDVSYREHEAAFLNGVFCALNSKSGKVAQIQGSDAGTMIRFNSGFRAGVQYVLGEDPSTAVVGFGDVNKGYETTMLYYDQGYDWVACCAAGSNLGAFRASEEKGGDYWCCGAADGQFHLMPERIVCSQVKTIDQVGYNYIKNVVETGDYKGGQWDVLGLAENGVDLIFNDKNPDILQNFSEENMDKYEDIRTKVASGEIKVPSTGDELAAFTDRYSG